MKKAALIAIVAGLAIVPASGEASKATSSKCPKQAFCIWTKTDYQGKKKVFDEAGVFNLGQRFNNRVSSVKSNWTKSEYARLYEKKDGKGSFYRCFTDDALANDLGTPGWSFNNQGSSVVLPKGDVPGCNV